MTGTSGVAFTPEAAETELATQKVAILDAGAQYGKVIDRRIRNLQVESRLLPIDTPLEELEEYDAFIISGGPESVYSPNSPKPDPRVLRSDKPILGICFGMQLLNYAYGGEVKRGGIREDGQCVIDVDPSSHLFKGLKKTQKVLMSHGDSVTKPASGFAVVAKSGDIIAAIADEKRQKYGVQFHPEVDLTEKGQDMLANFLFKVAKLEPSYTLEDRMEEAIRYIRETVGDRQVLSFASGGVDSTVCSVLIGKALPAEQIKVVHINTGFMRHRESEAVLEALSTVGIEMDVIDAQQQFFSATTIYKGKRTAPLSQVTDPEIKRNIIGDTFIEIMNQVIHDLELDPDNTLLAQGTLRPDLIESASSLVSAKADVIKTHHNDTEMVRQLRQMNRVVEPLQDLHKDEVRKLGESLGLPAELVWRQPFPGPALAIRLLCAKEPYITDSYDAVSKSLKAFEDKDTAAHLLPVRTVGVQGDGRTYSYLAALSGKKDWPQLMELAREIPKRIHDINRVVYVFGDKLQGRIQDITPTYPTPETVEQLRQADKHVNDVIRSYRLNEVLSQVPVVSFPVGFGEEGNRSIGIRTFITNDFMTGVPATPGKELPIETLEEMVDKILTVPGIARVVYDLTAKPPGTTEWE